MMDVRILTEVITEQVPLITFQVELQSKTLNKRIIFEEVFKINEDRTLKDITLTLGVVLINIGERMRMEAKQKDNFDKLLEEL
jgi:hypothetical protein